MRYIRKQNDNYSCTPLAVANALKWAGYKFSWKASKKEFCWALKTTREGTERKNVNAFLSSAKKLKKIKSSRAYKNITVKDIIARVKKGEAAIIGYYFKDKKGIGGHTFFVSGLTQSGHSFYTVNLRPGRAHVSTLQRRLTSLDTNKYPYHVWFIRKTHV